MQTDSPVTHTLQRMGHWSYGAGCGTNARIDPVGIVFVQHGHTRHVNTNIAKHTTLKHGTLLNRQYFKHNFNRQYFKHNGWCLLSHIDKSS